MKITIIGGGNIGTLMAAEIANKGHKVTMYTSKPERWQNRLEVYDAQNNYILSGTLYNVTNSMEEAVHYADYIFIAVPAQVLNSIATKMLPYINLCKKIGIIPGSGGAEFAFKEFIKKGCIIFGLQRVHSIARLKEYGKSCYMLGRKQNLQIGSIPAKMAKYICKDISSLFDMPCQELDNYLCVTLTPSNPILHPARLYSIFKDYKKELVYSKNILFYEEWNDFSSQILIWCDKELQRLCDIIPLNLKSVKSLTEYYESSTVSEMTNKIRSIKAFKGLTSPMVKTVNGWVPDFTSRYFTADFPFGLKIIKDIAKEFDVKIPYIDIIWEWYKNIVLSDEMVFSLNMNKKELIQLYSY